MKTKLFLPLLLLVATCLWASETTETAPTTAPERKALLEKLAKASGMDDYQKTFDQIMTSLMPTLKDSYKAANLPEDKLQKIQEVQKKHFQKIGDLSEKHTLAMFEAVYQNFTNEELQKLIEFYESDLGKKIIKATMETIPKMMAEMMQKLMPEITPITQEMLKEIEEILKEDAQ